MNQLDDGPGLHLPHDAGPVNLDRLLDDSELCGNLLVESPRHDLFKHLPLAGCQRVQPFRNRVPRTPCGAPGRVDPERFFYSGQQLTVIDGLREKVDGSCLHRANGLRDITIACQKDDGPMTAGRREALLQLETVQSRHCQVENDATGAEACLAADEELA